VGRITRDTASVRPAVRPSICPMPTIEGGRRGYEKKLFKKRFRLDVRKYVFSNRIVDRWNQIQLPEKCIKCSTVNTF